MAPESKNGYDAEHHHFVSFSKFFLNDLECWFGGGHENSCIELNAAELIVDKGKGKRTAIVGHFPFVPRVRESSKEVWVIKTQRRAISVKLRQIISFPGRMLSRSQVRP
jgi:hypothetical protein